MDYLEKNRKLWNAKTDFHVKSDFYNVESFLAGKNSLNSIELELLGNVSDKSILHLQCHFGMDTISLSRLGAKATGVDFSDKAILHANALAEKAKTNTRFIESDIYNLDEKLNTKFDIVFTSYGTIGWLPDMEKWASVVAKYLKPGGRFVMVEFHPFVWLFNDEFTSIDYDYYYTGAIIEKLQGTYADRSAPICNESISWNHSLSEVIGALLKGGLTIQAFQEFDYSPYDCFQKTVEFEPGKYQIHGFEKKIPMLYAIHARK